MNRVEDKADRIQFHNKRERSTRHQVQHRTTGEPRRKLFPSRLPPDYPKTNIVEETNNDSGNKPQQKHQL